MPVPATVVIVPFAYARRTRLPSVSATSTLQSGRIATLDGLVRAPAVPVDPNVVIVPAAVTKRTRLLSVSANT